jgi:hypothetical protein
VLQNFKGKDRLLIGLGQALVGDLVTSLIVFVGGNCSFP